MKSFSTSLVLAFVTIIFSIGQAQAFQTEKRRAPRQQLNNGDIVLNQNKNVRDYTAVDLRSVGTPNMTCPEGGHSQFRDMCYEYTSPSTNTKWMVQFVKNGRAETIFKMVNGRGVPWLYFEQNGTPVYLSELARLQHAGSERQKAGIAIAQPQAGTAILECEPRYVVRHGARECSDRRKNTSGVVEHSRRESPNIGTLLGIGNAIGGILQQGR